MNEVTETERAEQTSYFLGSVCNANETSEQWTVQLQVDSTPMEFKIDTGADVTVISEDTFHILTPERTLAPPDIPLDSPGGELLCRFDATASHKGKDYPFTAYVVWGHRVNNLLSRALAVRMILARRVDEVKPNTCHLQVYGEHGTLKTECEHNKNNYLVISNYYSRFLEVLHLPSTTSTQVILRLKTTFARFGIPNSPAQNFKSWQNSWTSDTSRQVLTILRDDEWSCGESSTDCEENPPPRRPTNSPHVL